MLNRLNNYFGLFPQAEPNPSDNFRPHPSWAKINQEKREARERLEQRDENGNTPLIRAVMASDMNSIATLLQAGAAVDGRGYLGYTPLAVAAYYGFYDIAQYLIEHGASVDAPTQGSPAFRPLTIAIRFSRSEEIVRLLILSGADVNHPDGSGFTPLMTAAGCRQHGMVGMLLQAGADRSMLDPSGNTAEMHAAHVGCMDIVELLRMDARSVAEMDFSLPPKNNLLLASLPVVTTSIPKPMQIDDDLQSRKDKFFEDFIDPVTLEIIADPHVSKYGFVYDRSTIERLFAHDVQAVREPATNSPGQILDRSELNREPCLLLRNLLQKREAEWTALLKAEADANAPAMEEGVMDISPTEAQIGNEESPVAAPASSPVLSDTEQLRVKRRLFFEKGDVDEVKRSMREPMEHKKIRKG